jgi:hypothetical protein
MTVVGVVLLAGIALTTRWGGTGYAIWDPGAGVEGSVAEGVVEPVRAVAQRYVRGVAIAAVGGFWAGAIVTGPAVRLIMRLLAVTAGDDAQGRLTEADEVVGNIDLGGTIALIVFGGILTGMLSGAVYMIVRRWLPTGWLGGALFGALHLVVAATAIDPLRPDNPDFDLVGPGWLSVTTFGGACVLHGMAVAAFANRYSRSLPPQSSSRRAKVLVAVPLALPALLVVVIIPTLIFVLVGLGLTLVVSRFPRAGNVARSRAVLVGGRIGMGIVAIVLLPGVISDLHDVIVRNG